MVQLKEERIRLHEPGDIDSLSIVDRNEFRIAEEKNELVFIIPKEISNNKDKHVYKIGFLSEFLRRLYPEKNFTEICQIMSKHYDVFITRRQIDRHRKRFLKDSE